MSGEKNLSKLLASIQATQQEGEYVYVTLEDASTIPRQSILFEFKEIEATTLVLKRELADNLNLSYDYVCAWITLEIHSSLEAVGLTAAFSTALAQHNISCNVAAAYYHDHIFVAVKDATQAVRILNNL